MFCPVCKSEYREGFTKCSDCGAALVGTLPASKPSTSKTEVGATELLWSGDSSSIADIVGQFLEDEKILFDDEEVAFGKLRPHAPSVFKIWVRPQDLAAAKEAAAQALRYSEEQDRREISREESEIASEANELETGIGGNEEREDDLAAFDPHEAIAPVWTGTDSDTKDMVAMSLREVGIGSTVDEAKGKFAIRVEPRSESRAKEIVHEIVDQTPPQ